MAVQTNTEKHKWWNDLRHGGLLISPVILEEIFPEGPYQIPDYKYNNLRNKFLSFIANPKENLQKWLDAIFQNFSGLDHLFWLKNRELTDDYKITSIYKQNIKPNRVLFADESRLRPVLSLWIDDNKKVGTGKGKKLFGQMLEWMRSKKIPLGIITNGFQIRMVYAGIDYDAWAEWDIDYWFEESEYKFQLNGLYSFFDRKIILPPKDKDSVLLNAIITSRTRQGELSDIMSRQVREAVERLCDELNKHIVNKPELLDLVITDPVTNIKGNTSEILKSVYIAASRIIMRMVVILFAEARGLFPRSNKFYNQNYGLEGLYEQLRQIKNIKHDLANRYSAWPRLLGLFNLIYQGSSHPYIKIKAFGGKLFADLFPGKKDL
jgi:hypothetical protein